MQPDEAERRPVPLLVVIKTAADASFAQWREALTVAGAASGLPPLDIREWDSLWADPAGLPPEVPYAVVWAPQPGRLARLPGLRGVLSLFVGIDHILTDPGLPTGVPVVRMGGADAAQRMGEYVCLAALALLRDLPRMIAQQAARHWEEFSTRTAPETRIGMLGLGQLGARATEMLRGLGFDTAGWSTTRKHIAGVRNYAGPEELDALLARSDILISLLPDTPATRGLISARTLALLPRGAGFVNAGRGSLVVMPDLLAALESGQLGGAVLDVFPAEPLAATDPAWSHPRLLVTPHIASTPSLAAQAAHVAAAIATLERGEMPAQRYDPARGY